ncbi:hypothetical protein GCM10020220_078880 [Nonomuraea rubra]|uniref:hypothetical protein n=1 Tax=Nonomuraea rubra TaxID=46180 RepID=UPI0031E4FD40
MTGKEVIRHARPGSNAYDAKRARLREGHWSSKGASEQELKASRQHKKSAGEPGKQATQGRRRPRRGPKVRAARTRPAPEGPEREGLIPPPPLGGRWMMFIDRSVR